MAKRVRKVLYPELGEYFTELRVVAHPAWSQQHASNVAADRGLTLTYQSLRGLERGETKCPAPETLRAVAELYDAPYAELVAMVVHAVYGLPVTVSSADRGVVIQLPPSNNQGGDDVPAQTRLFQGWREELLPEVLDAAGQLADLIARSRTTDPEAPSARGGQAKRGPRPGAAR